MLQILVFFWFFRISFQLDCTSQNVVFGSNNTRFKITSDPNDLTPKLCKFTFTLPKYYVPTVAAYNLRLTDENRITMRQYTEYGGSKNYELLSDGVWKLAPVNFTMEVSISRKTPGDSFLIDIQVVNTTPSVYRRKIFMVQSDLGEIIDSADIPGNGTMVQLFDDIHPQTEFSIRIVMFTELSILINALPDVHVYDSGNYKGNLLDVLSAENVSQPCRGTQFSIVNTFPSTFGTFSLIVSPAYSWQSQIFVLPAPPTNTTQILTATNGLTVFHEVKNPIDRTATPTIFEQISFRGVGTLDVYAGCVTGPQEQRRIATITPWNAANYEKLMLFGRCRTYVLSQGVFQWSRQDTYFSDYTHQIGRMGVIMSDTYPYTSTDLTTTRKYLIQAPNSKNNIIVTYEVAYISIGNLVFEVDQQQTASKDAKKYLGFGDNGLNFTSVATFQQMITYTVPQGTDGLLVRYTVTSSAHLTCSALLLTLISFLLIIRV